MSDSVCVSVVVVMMSVRDQDGSARTRRASNRKPAELRAASVRRVHQAQFQIVPAYRLYPRIAVSNCGSWTDRSSPRSGMGRRRRTRPRARLRSLPCLRAAHARTPNALASPGQSMAPSATPDARSCCACCLISIRLSERVAEDDGDDAQPLAHGRQQLARAHQQAAVAGQRDDRARRDRRSAAPIAAGSAKPIVDSPFEISMPFGSLTGHSIVAGNMCAPASTVTRAARSARRAAAISTTSLRGQAHGARIPMTARCASTDPRTPSGSQADGGSAVVDRCGSAAGIVRRRSCAANGTCPSQRAMDRSRRWADASATAAEAARPDRGRRRSADRSVDDPAARSLALVKTPANRGSSSGHDALGFVGDHRRHARAADRASDGASVRGPSRAKTDEQQRLARAPGAISRSPAFEARSSTAPSDSVDGAISITVGADATSPGAIEVHRSRGGRQCNGDRAHRWLSVALSGERTPDDFVTGREQRPHDRAADARMRHRRRVAWLSVNTMSGARSRYAQATPLTTEAAPGPSVVRHAPGRPVISACARAAIAPAVSVAVSTNGSSARPPPSIEIEVAAAARHAEKRADAGITQSANDTIGNARHEGLIVSPQDVASETTRMPVAAAAERGRERLRRRRPSADPSMIGAATRHGAALCGGTCWDGTAPGSAGRRPRAVQGVSRHLLARARRAARVPRRVRQGADRRGISRRADSRRVRRLGPRRHGGVDHPRRNQPQRRQRRRLPRADVHDGHAAAARLRGAEARATCRRSPAASCGCRRSASASRRPDPTRRS